MMAKYRYDDWLQWTTYWKLPTSYSLLLILLQDQSFDAHCCHMGTAIKHPVPDRVKPSFVIFNIRALWLSALSVRVPGCQKYKWLLCLYFAFCIIFLQFY